MTKLLLARRQEPPKLMISNFFIKRFWRIGPAYFTTIIFTLVAGWFVFLPLDYAKVAESALPSSIFFSNEYFKNQAGYFEDASVLKPLLHTWSLAVEMQFYLVWPIAYSVFRRYSLQTQGLFLIATVIASSGAALVLATSDPDLAFFTLPTRLWQFGLGALAANPWTLEQLRKLPLGNLFVQTLALIAIIASTFLINDQISWPAPWALIPSLATLILILSTDKTPNPLKQALGLPPMEWLGKISYSLYLVHWPIVCISHVYFWPDPPVGIRLLGLLMSVLLAWIMFKTIENPMRQRSKNKGTTNRMNLLAAGAVSLAVIASGSIIAANGFPSRFEEQHLTILMNKTEHHIALTPANDCTTIAKDCADPKQSTIFLWGDSHAGTFRDGLFEVASNHGRNFAYQINDACPPAPNIWSYAIGRGIKVGCKRSNRKAIQKIGSIENLEAVVLIARWSLYTTSLGFSSNERERRFVVSHESDELTPQQSQETLHKALANFISDMKSRNVRVIFPMQVPEHRSDPARCLKYVLYSGAPDSHCYTSLKDVTDRQLIYREMLRSLAIMHNNVELLETHDPFCKNGMCSSKLDGIIAYDDDDHLLPAAALKLLRRLPPIVKN